jgi:hypothetical protein
VLPVSWLAFLSVLDIRFLPFSDRSCGSNSLVTTIYHHRQYQES